jgi:hypothetical protein
MPDFTDYLDVCAKAIEDEAIYNNFKRDPKYFNIVGMHNHPLAISYIENISKNCTILKDDVWYTEGYLKLACAKDMVGNPLFVYKIGNNQLVESTSFRYMSVTSDLIRLFSGLKYVNSICEIGGGHGGQSRKILSYKRSIDYTIIDLKPVITLIEKIHDDLDLDLRTIDSLEETEHDLFISNYAFTECPREIQNVYMDKVLKNCKNGYMICNRHSGYFGDSEPPERTGLTLDEITDSLESFGKKINICDEIPDTTPHEKESNKLLTWSE